MLIDKGEYDEAVFVTTPSVTLRGVDRNAVILDGKFDLGTGIMVGGNGVAIENMTARNYTLNGFFWTAVQGFRGSYLTAYNNGDYGIYALGRPTGCLSIRSPAALRTRPSMSVSARPARWF